MRILLVISPFLPAQTPNTLRWIPILKEWSRKHYELHVITTRWTGDEHVDLNGVKVFRAGHHSLLDLWFNIRGEKNRRNLTSDLKERDIGRSKILDSIVNLSWRQVYWPDGTMLFVRPGKRKAHELHKQNNYDLIISVGLPYSCHLVARSLKIKYPDLKWIMDIQDPFAYSKEFRVNNWYLYRNINLRSELKSFKLADSIIVTNDTAKNKYLELFPFSRNKMHTIGPLFEKPLMDRQQDKNVESNYLNIAWFGTFYENVRSPESLLRLLQNLKELYPEQTARLRFHIFGESNEYGRSFFDDYPSLKKHFQFYGLLRRDALYSHLVNMDFLINFGNTTKYHLPSKLVEFLYLQKPVINFIARQDDSSKIFLDGKLPVCHIQVESGSLAKASEKFISFINREELIESPSLEAVSAFLPGRIASAYLDTLNFSD